MTRSIATLALVTLFATAAPALAQSPAPDAPEAGCPSRHRGHGGRFSPEAMEHRLERLTTELSLDEHQVGLVRDILAAARDEARALPHDRDREARHAARRALFESVAARIDAILTDAQRVEFARIRAEMEARHAERRARRESRRGAPEGI